MPLEPERYELVHGIGTFLTMGAAAAAAKVRGFGEEAFRRTFGIAGPMSALPHAGKFGWGEPTLSWLKDNVAWAAEAGHRAAALADSGLPASQTIFDGEKGFWRMAASDVYQPEKITDQKTFYIRQIGFKTYACCRWLHGMLDAVADVQAARAFRPEEISRVRIEAARAIAATFGNKRPATMVDAQFSAPHAVAMQLLAVPKLSWWQAEHRVDPHVLALIDKVELVEDPALTQRFYELGRDSNRIPARVIVELSDGWRGKAYNEEASGAAGRRPPDGSPGPDAETLTRKRDELLATRLSSARRERLRDCIARLEDAPHVAELTSLLEPDIAVAA